MAIYKLCIIYSNIKFVLYYIIHVPGVFIIECRFLQQQKNIEVNDVEIPSVLQFHLYPKNFHVMCSDLNDSL